MKIAFSRKNGIYPQFSNYYECTFEYDGIIWRSAEAAFQAQKTMNRSTRELFATYTPGKAKKEGKRVPLRPDWDLVKFGLMYDICLQKFSQNEYLKQLLLSTGAALLVEDTTGWHDNVYGCCNCFKCRDRISMNMLGVILMRVRNKLAGKDVPTEFTYKGQGFEISFEPEAIDRVLVDCIGRRAFSDAYHNAE